jgi:hypothetical protein
MSDKQTKSNKKTNKTSIAAEEIDEPRIFVAICR